MDTTSSSSESDSTSNSSDSGSSTTSDREKRGKSLTKATKFSVTSSDKSGLKMKIAAIPRNIKSALKSTKKDKSLSQQKKATKKRKNVKITQGASKNIPSDASSTSSYCSACNESESESSSDENTNIEYKKTKKHRRNRKSKTNQSVSSSSEVRTDSSDSELCKAITNERNSEDLAGILPSECIKEFEGLTTSSKCHIIQVAQNMTNLDTSNSTIANTSSYVTTMKTNIPPPTEVSVDGGSSSDMELPAIVNAAIKLVENCSDSEAGGKPTIPLVQYNSPLLLDFMVKTQMLGKTSTSIAENLHSKAAITFTRTTESEINEDPHNRKLHIKNQTLTSSPLSCLTSPFVKNDEQESVQNKLAVVEKRKRGRPRKQIQKTSVGSSTIPKNNPTTTTSGSPDSGILSITQSPSHSPNTGRKHIVQIRNTCDSSSSKNLESTMKKTLSTGSLSTTINLASLEKSMYATERVLYPPRGRRRGPGRPSNKTKQTKTEETIDPAWTKIDINKKFRRPSVSGYKSDGGTVCSKVLASQCGYTSDYGAIRRNRLSGYRSDYSKKSGYRSDYSIKAKSCGYRSDCSIRHRKKVRRKRRMKANSTVKSAVTDQDILQLAGLSLGQSSEENSLDTQPVTLRNCENFFISSLSNNNLEMTKKLSINPLAIANVQEIHVRKLSKSNPMSRRTENLTSSFKDTSNQKSVENINTFDSNKTTTNFESKMKSMTSFASISSGKLRENLKNMEENSCSFDTLVVNCELKMSERTCLKSPSKAATIRSRRSSAVSRCSSRSTMSRHYLKRRRKKRLRSRNESIGSRLTDSKFLQELDRLIISFDDLCHISENGQKNVAKEQERESEASNLKNNSKRATKKRKVTDVAVSPSTSTSGKRRNKKAQTDQSPDDHKLPLKKRHYLLMPGEKSENRLLEDKFQFEPSCSCKPNTQCAEDCLNRVVYTECNTETCPCGDKCQNTKIQKHEYAPGLEKFMTVNKGWGVRTKTSIKKSTFIIEYVGEVVTDREFKDRMATVYIRDTHHYCLHLDGGLVIDGHRMGSDGRFVNHSCAPNCEMQKWSVNGLPRMVLFAARDIKAGEELTYDYNFALFNPAEGQPCLCESSSCRGVIGGKSQRIKPMEPHKMLQSKSQDDTSSRGRSRKRTAKKNQFQNTGKDRSGTPLLHVPSNKEQIIIKESHCFLLRNLGKIRRLRDRLIQRSSITMPSPVHLFTRITEVRSPRNIRTRGLTVGDHDPEIDKMAKMAVIFKDLCSEICNFKETGCQSIINKLALPSKKKLPQYYEKVIKPIDMTQIEAKVERGEYKNPSAFDEDVQRLFNNVMLFYPSTSDEAKAAQSLMTLFANKKQLVYEQLVQLVDDRTTLKGFERSKVNELVLKAEPNEDVIHCICGLFKDEGLMIQCSDCQVWQHTECTKANTEIENYKCEKCEPRPIDLEIPLDEFTDEGYRYYISLLRGQLQVRQSDTVYVLRDIPVSPDPKNPNLPLQKHTYKTIGDIDFSEFDIFRVERLWKDNEGKRFVFGHQYLKPHETYHEPTRKFYPNEVVRVPLYEVVPIELIMGRCWVLDPTTYCKGRPVDCDEKHVYICELRVDKGARLFSKISKHAYPTCTKSYAFRKFDQKQKISRTYAPHEVKPMKSSYKPKKRKDDNCPIMSRKNSTSIIQLMPPPPKTLNEKRNRLEETLMNLMNRLKSVKPACLPPMDLSYLLTGRGARQRRANATSVPG
ncbi:Histone-lysine N-methyltransferase ash1 [Sergentomyia squamirostris]